MVFSNAWAALTTWAKLRLIWSLNHQISMRLLERYLYRPYSYFLSRNTADLSKTLLSEVQQLTQQMIQPVILAIGRAVVALGIVIVLIATSPALAFIVTVVVGGSYALIYTFIRKRLNAIGKDRR
jgi:ABC-type bacteriocin/lantibiotic exporters, contain an N-terminal double-glycine peptidase domain